MITATPPPNFFTQINSEKQSQQIVSANHEL